MKFGECIMIAFLNGIIDYVDAENENCVSAIIDVNGVGYNVNISVQTAKRLPHTGECVKLYTHMSVKEDEMSLYGFLSKGELAHKKG